MDFLSILDEQASFLFTGKVNFLLAQNKQFAGAIYLLDGEIVHAEFGEQVGEHALLRMIIESAKEGVFVFVVEPEIVTSDKCTMRLTYEMVKAKAKNLIEKHLNTLRLRPLDSLYLDVSPEYVERGVAPTSMQFEVLSLVARYHLVGEIYKYSHLPSPELTESLVALRKIGAIKVISK